ncbi:hypothetical protein HN803_00450 [candidate division WWE3 bacterium]|jgi:hypothetical protein|nr:hypothetical protein [candidate division WWE3 bacterium]MBT7349254.1 hypothetical protein [candidate division WWE3 bacterium]
MKSSKKRVETLSRVRLNILRILLLVVFIGVALRLLDLGNIGAAKSFGFLALLVFVTYF